MSNRITIKAEEEEEYKKFLEWQKKQEANKIEKRPQVFEHTIIHHCKICDGIFRVRFKSAWNTSPSKVEVWGCRECKNNLKHKDQEWLYNRLLQIKERFLKEEKDL